VDYRIKEKIIGLKVSEYVMGLKINLQQANISSGYFNETDTKLIEKPKLD
jgi:hypothetical protein